MERIKKIVSNDKLAYAKAKSRWDSIAKPLGGFGELEEMLQKIAAVCGSADIDISKRAAVIFCGDHGVTEEGVTQCGSEVTALCAADIAKGRSNINALAKVYGVEVFTVDVGIAADVEGVINKKQAYGTKNFTKGPAMTKAQTCAAVTVGMDMVKELKDQGFGLIVSGEMGIGNTTAAAALSAAILGVPPEKVTGRGAGLSAEGLEKKINAVGKALEINKENCGDALGMLAALGGYEIAAMTGLFLGGAYYKIPVVIDGVVSAAAAAAAYELNSICADYMLAGHCSSEPASVGLLEHIGLKAIINGGLHIGEGTGAILLVSLLDGAAALYKNARGFDEAKIERYTEYK